MGPQGDHLCRQSSPTAHRPRYPASVSPPHPPAGLSGPHHSAKQREGCPPGAGLSHPSLCLWGLEVFQLRLYPPGPEEESEPPTPLASDPASNYFLAPHQRLPSTWVFLSLLGAQGHEHQNTAFAVASPVRKRAWEGNVAEAPPSQLALWEHRPAAPHAHRELPGAVEGGTCPTVRRRIGS